MRQRPSARLLVLDPEGRVLLFHFKFPPPLAKEFWATPGGAVDAGESFAEAARRELHEETGITVNEIGPSIHTRHTTFQTPDGELVSAEEKYFLIRIPQSELSRDGWTELEQEVMTAHRWWTVDELEATTETVFPEELATLLREHV